ncbi:MAG: cobalt transporter CbiM [Oscillospiraceae bacterium]|nr:cobalt transporter CbiM [Oscillospiraceae bacterium]
MHIPENYLSPVSCGVMGAAMVPVWVHAVRKVNKEVPKEKIPLLGAAAAFSFLGMMFNVPLPGGTTGHAVGGTLIALLFGPNAACLAVSVALLLQAVIFGDGGILAFGANCFNMAFVLPFVGYGIYRLLMGKSGRTSKARPYIAAALGSYVGLNAAALCAAVEFGIQPMLFKDAAGNALYCPYDLSVAIPAMMVPHLLVAGVIEAAFTVAVYALVRKTAPDLTYERIAEAPGKDGLKRRIPIFALIAALIAAVPLGLLATGTAWGEWGADEIADVVVNGKALGYTPAGLEKGWSLNVLMPDYALEGMNEVAAYILSAVIGVALLIILFKLLSLALKGRRSDP